MRLAAALTAVALLLGVSPALAQPGNTPPGPPAPPPPAPYAAPAPQPYWQPPPARRTKRYGTTIAAVDGLSVAAVFVGALVLVANDNPDSNDESGIVLGGALMIGGAAGLFVGSPIVHYREGNSSGVWKSLGLRVGLPLLAGAIVEGSRGDCDPAYEDCETGLESLPGLLFLGGMVVDWFVLAKVEVEAPVTPYVAPSPYGGATVGIGGTF